MTVLDFLGHFLDAKLKTELKKYYHCMPKKKVKNPCNRGLCLSYSKHTHAVIRKCQIEVEFLSLTETTSKKCIGMEV